MSRDIDRTPTGRPFVCPVCGESRRTLRDILTCCPTDLRILTEALTHDAATTLTGIPLPELLSGRGVRRARLCLLRHHAARAA